MLLDYGRFSSMLFKQCGDLHFNCELSVTSVQIDLPLYFNDKGRCF